MYYGFTLVLECTIGLYLYCVKQGPCVLFASPGMLNGGVSLEVFKHWAPDPKNLVVLPGHQVHLSWSLCLQ